MGWWRVFRLFCLEGRCVDMLPTHMRYLREIVEEYSYLRGVAMLRNIDCTCCPAIFSKYYRFLCHSTIWPAIHFSFLQNKQ